MTRATSRPPIRPIACLSALLVSLVLAACGTAAPPAASTPSVGPSASAFPSASAEGTASGSSAPDSDSAAAVDAFLAFIETQQTFHLSADIQMTVAGKAVDMDVISDVGKAAEKGFIDIRGAGVSVHLELILVDKVLYIRPAQREWQAIAVETTGANPLADLRSDDLQPVDRVNVAGTLTHHLHVADARGQVNAQTLSGNTLTDLQLDSATFDVYVTDDGVPLTAIYTFAGTGAFAGVPAPLTAKIRYDFSKFGQDVSIVPPPGVSPPP